MAIGGDPIEDIDFPRVNPTKNPAIMSPVDELNPANDNIFPTPTNFYPPNPSQVSERVNDIEQVSEGVNDIKPAAISEGEETAQNGETSTRPQQNVGMYKDGPAIIQQLPIEGESYDLAFNSNIVNDWENPVPAVAIVEELQNIIQIKRSQKDSWLNAISCKITGLKILHAWQIYLII